jgi:hypothetical protein
VSPAASAPLVAAGTGIDLIVAGVVVFNVFAKAAVH